MRQKQASTQKRMAIISQWRNAAAGNYNTPQCTGKYPPVSLCVWYNAASEPVRISNS